MTEVFLIMRAWTDSFENTARAAFGYAAYGFVRTEAEALRVCAEGGPAPACWANRNNAPLYIYTRLPEISRADAIEKGGT